MGTHSFLFFLFTWDCIRCGDISLDEVGVLRFVRAGRGCFGYQSLFPRFASWSFAWVTWASHYVWITSAWRREQSMVIFEMTPAPNKSPEPTAVGAVSSAIAGHVASRRWLSFFR